MAKKKTTKKKVTRKKAVKKKPVKKSVTKKTTKKSAINAVASTLGAETDDQLFREVQKLLKSKKAENVRTAIELLRSINATKDQWLDAFPSRIISLLVNTWDVGVWSEVDVALSTCSTLEAGFHKVAMDRFRRLSEVRREDFFREVLGMHWSNGNLLPFRDQLVNIAASLVTVLVENAVKEDWATFHFHGMEDDVVIAAAGVLGDMSGVDLTVGCMRYDREDLLPPKFKMSPTRLPDKAAEHLSKSKVEFLTIMNITTLSDVAAESLSRFKGKALEFSELTGLSNAAVESLSRYQGEFLTVTHLTEISDAAAQSLSRYRGCLTLGGGGEMTWPPYGRTAMKDLTDAAAESLSKLKGDLSLDGLTSLSDAAAESLSKLKGALGLNGLTSLSDALAESLSKHEGELSLRGLTSLSDAAAESLSKLKGDLGLYSLTSLSDAAAESLSKHEGELRLSLDNLPDSAAQILRDADLFLVDMD